MSNISAAAVAAAAAIGLPPPTADQSDVHLDSNPDLDPHLHDQQHHDPSAHEPHHDPQLGHTHTHDQHQHHPEHDHDQHLDHHHHHHGGVDGDVGVPGVDVDVDVDVDMDPDLGPDETGNTTMTLDDHTHSAGGTPKERHSLTLDQRRALRRWAHSQTTRPSHKACIEWFFSQYGQHVSQSTISHSLSPKYARLDNDSQFSGSRLRFGNWPDVEKLVLLWHSQVVASGRNPSNEELAEKAKSIFTQLPRYKDESPPEFSPGWIHRFKKRYGLLIRRQRRHGTAPNPAEDIPYLVDAIPRFMSITAETSPATIRDAVLRVVGVEASLATCARVRDEVVRRIENPPPHPGLAVAPHPNEAEGLVEAEDPEVVLQNALRQMQQEEEDAEAEAAAVREQRDRQDQGLPPIAPGLTTPGPGPARAQQRFTPTAPEEHALTLTPIASAGALSTTDRPLRCPFCVNQRMLRSIKEAVEHMSTHVVV